MNSLFINFQFFYVIYYILHPIKLEKINEKIIKKSRNLNILETLMFKKCR